MRHKTVITNLLQSVTEVYYKMRQVSQSVTDCYYKVPQVLQSVTSCYYKVHHVNLSPHCNFNITAVVS